MKKMSLLTLVVTDACNFNCSYCPQVKGDHYLSKVNAKKFIDFFFPFLKDESSINFYGGEPLLAFDIIEYVVDLVKRKNKNGDKKIKFQVATNGSLLDDYIIRFLVRNDFQLLFSFDGLAQDIGRKKGTFDHQVTMIRKMAEYPTIRYEVNCVSSAGTVPYLSDSIRLIHGLGVRDIMLSIDARHEWNREQLQRLDRELKKVVEFNRACQATQGTIPVMNYRGKKQKAIFACNAGRDRMSIHPEGNLWGCNIFNDYFQGNEKTDEYQQYSFGHIDSFVRSHEKIYAKILKAYSDFRQDSFYTQSQKFCFLCNDLECCAACPAMSGHVTGTLGMVPDWFCRIKKIEKSAFSWLHKKIDNPTRL